VLQWVSEILRKAVAFFAQVALGGGGAMMSFVGVRGEAYRVESIGVMLLTGCVAMLFCVRKFWRGHGNGRV